MINSIQISVIITKKINHKMNKLKFGWIFLLLIWWVDSQCCISLQGKKCIRCPNGTHLYRDNCIIDVDNCATYKDGFDCLTCNNGFQLNTNGECIPTPLTTTDNSKDYVDTILDLQNLSTINRNIYTLSNDYFNAFKIQIKSAQPTGAILRLYKNNTLQITIQYKGLNNIYYQGILQPDVLNFVFKEISFGVIPAPTVPVQPTINQTSPSTAPNNIDISNLPASTNTISNNVNITLTYKNFDVNSNDQSYLIAIDFVNSQLPKYSKLKPTVVLIATTNSLTYYKLTFSLADRSIWQVTLTFSPQNFFLNLISDLQIQSSPNAPAKTFQKVDKNIIYKDFIFIIVHQYINKQSNNKYKDSVIKSVEKADDAQNTQYKVIFQQGGFQWQVLAQFNKNNFLANGYQQNKKSQIPKVNQNPVSVNGGTLNTITQEVSITSNTAKNQSQTPLTSNPTISTNPDNDNNININPRSTLNTTITTTTDISNNTTPTPTSNSSLNQNSNNTASTNNLISNTTIITNTTPIPTPIPTANSTITPNPNPNLPINPDFNNSIVLPQKITQNIVGLTQLSATQLAGAQFTQIQALIKNANVNQLSGASLVGAYIFSASFTRNYRIYYRKNQQFFQIRVTRDSIRRRTYILSFTKII